MYNDDDRVAPMVAEKVMVRSWGKPPDYDLREDRPALKINMSTMSPGECALLLGLLRRGLPVPSEPELDEVPPDQRDGGAIYGDQEEGTFGFAFARTQSAGATEDRWMRRRRTRRAI
jgi:hypothetical protein